MSKRRIQQAITTALAFVLCSALHPSGLAQSATEDEVKAAYLYNFARFVEWPDGLFSGPGAIMQFCALGRSPASDKLGPLLEGKRVDLHAIVVRRLMAPDQIGGCHIVFLAASAGKLQQKLLLAAKGRPILLVAEVPGFAKAGGAIDFMVENGRVIFEVNLQAAESSHLKISSKVLALARIVPGDEQRWER